jgi:hypothetical protein
MTPRAVGLITASLPAVFVPTQLMPRIQTICAVAAITFVAACHRGAPVTAAAPSAAGEMPCWWTVYRSPLRFEEVAAHLASAFTTVGLSGAMWTTQGDTAWAQATPTRLASRFGGTFSARAVVFQRGDSALYRYFVAADPPPGGWPPAYDTVTATGVGVSVNPEASALGLCVAIASNAHNSGTAPKEPDGEEGLAVWSSRPPLRGDPDARLPIADPVPPAPPRR